jgi:hypothetical protein
MRTNTGTEIGRGRMTHLQGQCSYSRAEETRKLNAGRVLVFKNLLDRCAEEEGEESMSVECVFATTPRTDALKRRWKNQRWSGACSQ